ncbi:venom metalloproteinase antarease TserMP_A-like [Eriocheir sinensis]|uniref:venom metalloproteinase antarease TserMP_A-like n=1 Tax=Eriocheir sinensis TaxID=95602 RepID=UPI0021CA12E4|nr:venom metalloproteinase antarease TserMP_A-like [Eriocheir sinensis]
MKPEAGLLLVCLWAANCQVHGLAAPSTKASFQRSTATVIRGTSRSPLGSSHLLHVDAFDQRHTLRLQPAVSPFADTFRLQTTARDEEGRLIFKDVSYDEDHDTTELYQDPESGGVVRVSGTRVEGIISSTLTLTADADGQHEAVRQEIVPDFNVKDELEVPPEERLSFESSATTRAVSSATVEMYVIVDSTLAASVGTDQKVKDYLAVFWNAVNMRYATFSDPKIQLVLAGALIVRDAADEPYVTSNIASSIYVNGYGALEAVSKWLYQQKTNLPDYDLAYLMTGKNMFSPNGGSTSLAGLAYREAACVIGGTMMYKTGMGEDNSYYGGVMTAAHEVAHNLGSPHDGSDGSEACSWNLGYIMNYLTIDSKKLLFSSCSQAAMKKYISTSSGSCLQSTSTGATIPLSDTLPGQILSLDKQCQIATDKTDAYASKSVSEDTLCYKLVCQWKVQEGYTTWTYTQTTGRPAAEGSPCKSGGACKDGSCQ